MQATGSLGGREPVRLIWVRTRSTRICSPSIVAMIQLTREGRRQADVLYITIYTYIHTYIHTYIKDRGQELWSIFVTRLASRIPRGSRTRSTAWTVEQWLQSAEPRSNLLMQSKHVFREWKLRSYYYYFLKEAACSLFPSWPLAHSHGSLATNKKERSE